MTGDGPPTGDSVLLVTPSRGLGGGIERYVSTVEAAFTRHGVRYSRMDLRGPDQAVGPEAKLRFACRVTQTARRTGGPLRLVVAHRNLLPVVYPLVRMSTFRGAVVIVHGCELWTGRGPWSHRLLRRPDVRVVAVSNFTAGALMPTCQASVLYPGLAADWYHTLVAAGDAAPLRSRDVLDVATAFRLEDWRNKGLETLLEAVRLLGDERVTVTVCGSGPVPADLRAHVGGLPYCRIEADLPDIALARRLAAADLFVLSTRTRRGAAASGEGFGLVLLEAQLAGTPVVAPPLGGCGEAFQPGVTGLAPLDESAPALAKVLAALLHDDHRRAGMARAAAAWSRRRFEPDAHSAQVVRTLLGAEPAAIGG
jgi:glycosyltransferase involved in cell wall biosynthesis